MWAAMGGHKEIVSVLLQNSASVLTRDNDGGTAAAAALTGGYEDIFRLLIEAGADLNARSFGQMTLLMIAANRGLKDSVKLLLLEGAEVGLTDSIGNTALDYGIMGKYGDIVRMIRMAGGDANHQHQGQGQL
jgi:ankyrin repeat protein